MHIPVCTCTCTHTHIHTHPISQSNWTGHIWHRNCLPKHIIEGKKWWEDEEGNVSSYLVTLWTRQDTGIWRGSTRSHSVENWLWTCHKKDHRMNEWMNEWISQYQTTFSNALPFNFDVSTELLHNSNKHNLPNFKEAMNKQSIYTHFLYNLTRWAMYV